jgi:hypothetical protein
MTALRFVVCLALGASAGSLSGCFLPKPVAHAVLRVSSSGAYELDGKALAPEQLADAIAAKQVLVPSMVLEVRASPEAGIESVRQAVRAARSAHARVAFARESSPP